MNATLTPQIEVHPLEQAPLPTAKPPKFIKGIISEEDRQAAGKYCSNGSCLIATMLKRLGYKNISVAPTFLTIGNTHYTLDFGCGTCHNLGEGQFVATKPHYGSSVVGKVISLTRQDNNE